MRHDIGTVARVLDDFFKGHSPPDISDSLEQEGVAPGRSGAYRMIAKHVPVIDAYTSGLPLNGLGDRFGADEIFEKIGGKMPCIFGIVDVKTRLLLATEMSDTKNGFDATGLPQAARERAGKKPTEFVTDGLESYGVGFDEAYAPKNPLDDHGVHIADAGLGKPGRFNNNVVERFNGTQRRRYAPRRGIKRRNSPVFPGFRVWYNFARRHTALGRSTPAEAAGVRVHGDNKWVTLIGNACVAAWGA